MVDFSKLVEKKRVVDVSDPIRLFHSLDRQASHTTLRPTQEGVLEKIRERRNERDMILKMSTGAGKTTVALLYLKSHMAEKGRPGVYLCPKIQLVNQVVEEAFKLGIEAVHYAGGKTYPGPQGMSGQAVIVCTYDKLFNAKTTFDRDDVLLRPCAIVLDDAHAGVEEVRDAFTLRLMGNDPHEHLLELLGVPCDKYMPGKWSSIMNQDPDEFFEVPYWLWKPMLDEVQKNLSPYSNEDDFCFVWPYLRDHLRWCRCVVSGPGIEIIPDILPINMVKAFYEANHRLFMSATLADDSTLVRELSCDPFAAKKSVFSPDDTGIGERMVLAPSLVHKDLTREWVMKWCQWLSSKKVSVVVLSPSEKAARDWEAYGATIALGDDVNPCVLDLRSGKVKFIAFAQRYDGIDLPDNSCRVLVIDGMPYGQGITDKYDSRKLGIPGGTRNRMIYRIEQGMGRAVRSQADYAVVILSGPELANFIAKREVLESMNLYTKVQLKLALRLAEVALEDGDTEPSETLTDMIRKCLLRDEGWKQFYDEQVRNAPTVLVSHVSEKGIGLAAAEQKAAQAAMAKNPEKANEIIEKSISDLVQDEKEKGWFLQKAANYKYEIDPGKALEMQRFAYEKNSTTFCPPGGVVLRPPDPGKFESSALALAWYKSFDNPNGAIAELQTLRAQLSYDVSPKTLVHAIIDLARPLGARGSSPEEIFGEGPDNLWLWSDISFVIEVKNERQKTLPKKDSGQLHDSLQWFKNNYPARSPTAVVVAKVASAEKDAHFPDSTRVLTQIGMNGLLDNLEAFVGRLVKRPPLSWKPQKVTDMQSKYGLLPQQFIGKYTVPLK